MTDRATVQPPFPRSLQRLDHNTSPRLQSCEFIFEEDSTRAFFGMVLLVKEGSFSRSISIWLAGAPSPRGGTPFLSSRVKVFSRDIAGLPK